MEGRLAVQEVQAAKHDDVCTVSCTGQPAVPTMRGGGEGDSMRKSRGINHTFVVQPPSEHCPPGASYACYCKNCGEARGIFVPCDVDDFLLQMKAFNLTHKHCKPSGAAVERGLV